MAINANELDSDLKEFETEEGAVESVADDDLAHWWFQSQEDSFGGESSSNVKKFFDYIARHVFLPWLNAITKVLNALKGTVEKDYLKSERVQQEYDPKSAEPMSGKAVAEAAAQVMELTDADTIWEAIRLTGCYLEQDLATQSWMVVSGNILNAVVAAKNDSVASSTGGWAMKVRIFVKDLSENAIYFISAYEALAAAMEDFSPVPILKLGGIKGEVMDALFPTVTDKTDITSQASWYALPFDDAKVEVYYDESDGIPSYVYLYNQDTGAEPQMYFREGATSPLLLPDDFADQEMAATYWKAGNYLEAGSPSKATLITTKAQTDKTALSPSRMAEILCNEATETKTFYIPVARFNDSFALTEEMKENGLVIRRNAPNNDFLGASFTIYSPSGSIVSEPSITVPEEAGAVLPFDVSGYEVGSQFLFYGWTDYSYGGNLEVQMPVAMEYVSKEKLAELLTEEVSGE